ncbi:glycosyltransferase family 10 [uncultured Agrobacterium sp.]|uniref:glycosyltransferase family 10 domain-containing protein n=1 Tax=uncultured Agrobacterium sp. TaxID=157277 RepID=UPI0025FF6210|nr:glycosyltransferase family 10 [uncultured Agrobacterium sp.]
MTHTITKSENWMTLRYIIYDPQQRDMDDMFMPPADLLQDDSIWHIVQTRFREIGFELATPASYKGDLKDVSFVIFQNMPIEFKPLSFDRRIKRRFKAFFRQPSFYQQCRRAGLSAKMAVILYEPEVVLPYNYNEKLQNLFAAVFTWNKNLIGIGAPYKEFVFPQPVWSNSPSPTMAFNERKLLCNFSANKKSSHPYELYSARIEAIKFFENACLENFDHYGRGWSDQYKSWKGPVANKELIMSKYKFNLCYENARGFPGYITEKIFDAFRAGCVPIYWGAPNVNEIVPPECFIDRTKFSSYSAMLAFIENMDEAEWRTYVLHGQAFLRSSGYSKFLPNSVFNLLKRGLRL